MNRFQKIYYIILLDGYFDGDGCICKSIAKKKYVVYKATILGTYEFCNSLNRILRENGIVSYFYKKGKVYVLEISKKQEVQKFFNFLYKNSTIYFTRKYLRFLETE